MSVMTADELYKALAHNMSKSDIFDEGPTRFGNRDRRAWFVDRREVAHVHSDGWIDIKLPKEARATLRNDPRAKPHADSDWTEFKLSALSDIQFVADLLSKSYSDVP